MYDLPGTVSDYSSGRHFKEILSIIGPGNRRDALHVDSAFKSGCSVFITQDHHILDHRAQLEALLGIKFFHPVVGLSDLKGLIAGGPGVSVREVDAEKA